MQPSHVSQGNAAQRSASAGFSLIEILVVLAIMAIAISVVMLNMGPREPSLAAEADRLARQMSAARDLALVRNRPVRVDLTPAGYEVLVQSRMGWTAPDTAGARTPWEMGTSPVLPREEPAVSIVFDSIGIATAGEIVIQRGAETQSIRIDGGGNIARGDPYGP